MLRSHRVYVKAVPAAATALRLMTSTSKRKWEFSRTPTTFAIAAFTFGVAKSADGKYVAVVSSTITVTPYCDEAVFLLL